MSKPRHPLDDLDASVATLTDAEREDLVAASEALDIAHPLHHARRHRGLIQQEAAENADMRHQAVSRLGRAAANVTLSTLQRYRFELG